VSVLYIRFVFFASSKLEHPSHWKRLMSRKFTVSVCCVDSVYVGMTTVVNAKTN